MSHPSCTGLSPVKMEILLSPKYRQGDECVLKNQGRLRTRKLFISHPGKQKEIETCSHYWGKEKKNSKFFPRMQRSDETSAWCDWISIFKADPCTHAHSPLWFISTVGHFVWLRNKALAAAP